MTKITQETVKTLFHYDPETGELWRVAKLNRYGELYSTPPKLVSGDNGAGYMRVFLNGRRYLAHVAIFAYMVGRLPLAVDHVNGDKQDNRWENLREVDHQTNMLNKGVYKTSKTGVSGVSRKNNKYQAVIQTKGLKVRVGTFETLEAAKAGIEKRKFEFGFHPNHGERPSWGN